MSNNWWRRGSAVLSVAACVVAISCDLRCCWVFTACLDVPRPFLFFSVSRRIEMLIFLETVGLWRAIVTSLLRGVGWVSTLCCSFLLAASLVVMLDVVEPMPIVCELFWPTGSDCIFLLCGFAVSVTLLVAFWTLLFCFLMTAVTCLWPDSWAADCGRCAVMPFELPDDLDTLWLMPADSQLLRCESWRLLSFEAVTVVGVLSLDKESSVPVTLDRDDRTLDVAVNFDSDSSALRSLWRLTAHLSEILTLFRNSNYTCKMSIVVMISNTSGHSSRVA